MGNFVVQVFVQYVKIIAMELSRSVNLGRGRSQFVRDSRGFKI